jgi:hypothetical protein
MRSSMVTGGDSMRDTPSGADGKHQTPTVDGAWVTLRGSVQQVIPSFGKNGCGLVELVIEDGEPLYREIRIRNPFQDGNGNVITLQADSELEITIKICNRK